MIIESILNPHFVSQTKCPPRRSVVLANSGVDGGCSSTHLLLLRCGIRGTRIAEDYGYAFDFCVDVPFCPG